MRALIDIEEEQIRQLDRLARKQKRSRASLIREAVSNYVRAQPSGSADQAFGLWGERKLDGLDYQERIRGEW